ncbi:uncharacterized protein AMSG_06188 [Thecamonas trahens ATCC 50062]|uniref:SH3 domain-containing protein n=1 Tax=Thecamonas trahens ATCC 50062 TaxID=461836 RepID=A0A0L0DCP2_THETB|nr:hypothetical protein AMSG_06188 [Thecamonas trahens ATCC 50062]KNC49891.1 hypothetical protein AMSG_06188 [Thecamonas trahens ATCC 50062]|eukprot:XP_013757373.1 hypothetical protein AMSG_06188 [Thecamonas trahens ATCC 50062]
MKAFRKAKRTVTRSIHQDLHHKIEEERDVAKVLVKSAETLRAATEHSRAWGDTTESSTLLAYAQMESQADAQWADALAEYGEARGQYAAVWAEVLEKERARDSAKKALAKAEANLESAQSKLAKAQGKANFEAKRSQLEEGVSLAEADLRSARELAEQLTDECESFTSRELIKATRANAAATLALCKLGTRVYSDLHARCEELDGTGGGRKYARTAVASAADAAIDMFDEDNTAALHATTASGAGLNPFDTEEASTVPVASAPPAEPAPAADDNPFADDPFADEPVHAAAAPAAAAAAAPATAAAPAAAADGNPFGDDIPDDEPAAAAAAAAESKPPTDDTASDETTVVARARAIADFAGDNEGELPFAQGDMLEITDLMDGVWYYGRNGEVYGEIPSNFVEMI